MKQKRLLPVVLALCLLLPLEAHAQEEGLRVAPERRTYCYAAPFAVEHTVVKRNGAVAFSGRDAAKIYRLEAGEEQAAIQAYCVEAERELVPGTAYRRVNLEDSTAFSDSIAQRVRSVLLNAYPQRSVEEIQDQANRWLRDREMPEVQNLQSGEAILAAQIALWKLTGGRNYTVHALFRGEMDVSGLRDATVSQIELTQRRTADTQSNIESLYAYFYNLPPAAPRTVLVSESAICRTVSSAFWEEEGYGAEITVTVEADIGEGDSLTLEARCGGQSQSLPLTEAGDHTFRFSGLEEPPVVHLEITGEQYGEDVFLFEGQGTKTLAAWDQGTRSVFCERLLTPVIREG